MASVFAKQALGDCLDLFEHVESAQMKQIYFYQSDDSDQYVTIP